MAWPAPETPEVVYRIIDPAAETRGAGPPAADSLILGHPGGLPDLLEVEPPVSSRSEVVGDAPLPGVELDRSGRDAQRPSDLSRSEVCQLPLGGAESSKHQPASSNVAGSLEVARVPHVVVAPVAKHQLLGAGFHVAAALLLEGILELEDVGEVSGRVEPNGLTTARSSSRPWFSTARSSCMPSPTNRLRSTDTGGFS